MNYDELMSSFKNLNDVDKKEAIMEFIEKNIEAMSTINKNIGNKKELFKRDIHNDDDLDNIYELLHVLTDEVSSFTEFVENNYFE